jgi:hypothetical protein
LKPASLRIFAGSTYTFSTSATDSFYNPITLNPALLSYRVSKPSLGTITSAGLFTAGNQTDTGYVIVTYGGIKDSAKITIKTVGYVKVNPSVVVTDHRLIVPFKLHIYDVDSMEVTVPENLVSWKCSDSTVGFIDDFGQFSGVEEGTAKIIGKYSNWRDTARVSVEIGRGKKVLDSLERLDQWSLAGQNYDSIATQLLLSNQYATLGLNSFNLDYHFIYQTGMYNWLFLKDSIRIYGIPDSICVDLRSDGAGHRLFWDFTDAQNQNVRVTCNKIASAVNTFERFAGTFPLLTSIVYPLTLKSITFALGSTRVQGQQYQGNIYIDNLRIVYPLSSSTGMEFRPPNKPGTFRLFHNYPNPCNPRTTVSVQLPEPAKVTLRLYSIIGKEVLSQEFTYAHAGNYRIDLDLSQFASGPYFYRVNFKGMTQQSEAVQKIMLLK